MKSINLKKLLVLICCIYTILFGACNSINEDSYDISKYIGIWKTKEETHESNWYVETGGELKIEKDGTLSGKIYSDRITDGYLSREANIEFHGKIESDNLLCTFDDDGWEHGGEHPKQPLNWSIQEGTLIFFKRGN
jgi:hypothetical protein